MIYREVYADEKEAFNTIIHHPLQSWQWGEFREKTKVKVLRLGLYDKTSLKKGFQITFHPLPKSNYVIGYLPKCDLPAQEDIEALKKIAFDKNCLFIKLEPQATTGKEILLNLGLVYGKPLFTKYTFELDLNQNEETLMANLKPKTRYNIKVAQKNNVQVSEDNSLAAFQEYLKLTFTTTKRQKFYAHDENYHQLMWQTLFPAGIAHLLKATYQGKTLVSWILFAFHKILYYPYGASSRENKEVMASNLMMWEAIRFGKRLGCQKFDMWGSLGPNPDPKDSWYGFHRFKEGYNPKLKEFIGTFDLVINQPLYKFYTMLDNLRWQWLKLKAKLPF